MDTDNPNRKHNSKFKDNCKGKLFAFCNDRENVCVFISKQSSPFIFSKLIKKRGRRRKGETEIFLSTSPSFSMLFQDPEPVSSQDEEFENTLKSNKITSVVYNFRI